MSRFRRRLMGLAQLREAKRKDFVRVEYIENTSHTAYIDTKIIANQNTNYEIKVQFTKNTGYPYIFGSQYAVKDRRFSLMEGSYNTFYYISNLHKQEINLSLTAEQQTANLTIKKDGLNMYIDGVKSGTFTNTTFTTPTSLTIFTCHLANGNIDTGHQFFGKLYYFKIYDGTTLVRDYIPMYQISTDTYGLWDRVEEKFYTSPNGVKFTGGREIIYDAEIEYLEKVSGTNSLINLGTNADAIFEITAQATTITNFSMTLINRHTSSVGGSWFGVPVVANRCWGLATTNGAYSNVSSLNKTNITVDFTVNPIVGTIDGNNFSRSRGTTNMTWHLFGSSSNSYPFIGRLYSLKAYIGGKLAFDLIPVRVGNVGYMYDKVSGKLFGNSGRDKFILGKDVEVYDKI